MENKKTLEADLYYIKKKIISKIFGIIKRSTIFFTQRFVRDFIKVLKNKDVQIRQIVGKEQC